MTKAKELRVISDVLRFIIPQQPTSAGLSFLLREAADELDSLAEALRQVATTPLGGMCDGQMVNAYDMREIAKKALTASGYEVRRT